jgi:hypothetical protein
MSRHAVVTLTGRIVGIAEAGAEAPYGCSLEPITDEEGERIADLLGYRGPVAADGTDPTVTIAELRNAPPTVRFPRASTTGARPPRGGA